MTYHLPHSRRSYMAGDTTKKPNKLINCNQSSGK